jgi:hypothetical protein
MDDHHFRYPSMGVNFHHLATKKGEVYTRYFGKVKVPKSPYFEGKKKN